MPLVYCLSGTWFDCDQPLPFDASGHAPTQPWRLRHHPQRVFSAPALPRVHTFPSNHHATAPSDDGMWWAGAQATIVSDGWCFDLNASTQHIDYYEQTPDHWWPWPLVIERALAPMIPLFWHAQAVGLHASAIAWKGRGWLFCGDAGVGKSTTAAEATTQGAQLLADDMALVDVQAMMAWPVASTLRLWTLPSSLEQRSFDATTLSSNDKTWLVFDDPAVVSYQPVPLAGLVILRRATTPAAAGWRQLKPSEAATQLLAHTWDMSNPPRAWRGQRFRKVCQLATTRPVWEVTFTPSLPDLTGHVASLLARLGELGAP